MNITEQELQEILKKLIRGAQAVSKAVSKKKTTIAAPTKKRTKEEWALYRQRQKDEIAKRQGKIDDAAFADIVRSNPNKNISRKDAKQYDTAGRMSVNASTEVKFISQKYLEEKYENQRAV